MNMKSPFNKVLIYKSTKTVKTPENLIICESPEEYNQLLENDKEGLCELIGGKNQQIKPIIDIDQYNTDIDIEAFKTDLNEIFPNKEFKYCKRKPRPYNGKMKYSYRVYVQDVRISYINLKQLILEIYKLNIKYPGIDDGLYIPSRILYTPNTKYKYDLKLKKYYEVPQLKIMDDAELFECCASYIEETFEDWDLKMPPIEIKKEIIEPKFNDNDNDYDETPNKYNRLVHLINMISPIRSDNFDTWIKFNWCLINICNKEHISKRKGIELIHQFSKLSTSNYNENDVDNWIDENYDRVKEKGYGWNYLIHTCIKEDNPKYYETISKSYFNMKKEFELNNAKILYPPMIVHKDRNGENIIQPIPLCEKTNRHIKCSVKEINKKDEIVYKDKKFIELWLDDPKIRKYDKYVFKPTPLKVEDYEYNTWNDFDITKTPLEKDDGEIINRFLDYMKNLFDDENVVNYIIAYFANRIQNPANRNMVCIILYGEEGDGKNRLFDIFKNIIGDKYYTELENAKQMFGSHSCVEKEKLFICVNEAKGKDNYENSETLKARITTDKLLINPKGIQEFKIDNFCDYIMTTNNANAVNLHDKSRRYLYVETTSYYSRNSEFFNKLSIDIVENPKALRIIYEYLKTFDIKSIIPSGNFQNHIPETEIQKVIIKNNRDKILWFLEDYINDYINDPLNKEETTEIKIKNSELFSKWNNWIERNKMDVKYNNIAFHSRLGQLMKKKINCIDECIYKDTNQNTFIRIKKLSSFFDKLNQ